MATSTFLDKQQKGLLKKYHTLCAKLGKSESEKREIVAAYGAVSSRELTAYDLMDICNKLDAEITPKLADYDKWRKRVIASIFAWRKALCQPTNINEVKAIACRAAKADSFNAIPLERLRSLYGAFTNKAKDLQFVGELTVEELEYMALMN
jgi:hypothetical protein